MPWPDSSAAAHGWQDEEFETESMWFYFVDGTLLFPTTEGPRAWRKAPLEAWKGKGKVTVGQVLGWITKEAVVDESAPPEFRNAFFFDIADDGKAVTMRGFIHRDDEGNVTALTDAAAALGAKGKVLMEHSFDRDSGIRLEVLNGELTVREGDVKMPRRVVNTIERESVLRASKLAGTNAPKKKVTKKRR